MPNQSTYTYRAHTHPIRANIRPIGANILLVRTYIHFIRAIQHLSSYHLFTCMSSPMSFEVRTFRVHFVAAIKVTAVHSSSFLVVHVIINVFHFLVISGNLVAHQSGWMINHSTAACVIFQALELSVGKIV